jgi:hypothetical protein
MSEEFEEGTGTLPLHRPNWSVRRGPDKWPPPPLRKAKGISTRADQPEGNDPAPPSVGPFESHASDVERFISALTHVWQSKELLHRREITSRLSDLRSACLEDELPLSLESVEQFARFLRRHNVPWPRLAITPDGNVRASWSPGQDQHFAIEFMGAGQVKFVLFTPRSTGVAGTLPDHEVLTRARSLGMSWLP